MKRITILLLFLCSQVFGQWAAVGNNGVQGTSYPTVYSLGVYNSTLYAGGAFDTAGGLPTFDLAMWNGTNWTGGFRVNGYVLAQTIFNGNLVIAGTFDTVNGIRCVGIAQWNGSAWSGFGAGINLPIQALAVYNGNLYAGCAVFNSYARNLILMWNGSNWQPLGTGVYNKTSGGQKVGKAVYSLTVYNSKLYVGGQFDSAGSVAALNIATWDGTNWSAVGTPQNDSAIFAMAVYKNELYAGGWVGSTSNYTSDGIIYKWNGNTWSSVNGGYTGIAHNGAYVSALCVYDSLLCIGGAFDTIGPTPARSIAHWDGTTMRGIDGGIWGGVQNIIGYNSKLYVGGVFTYVGPFASINANNIASWSGVLGINKVNNANNGVELYPNPNNGTFNISVEKQSGERVVEIYNMLGEKVFSKQLAINNSQLTINLSTQSSGVYLYRVSGTDGALMGEGKLMIQK